MMNTSQTFVTTVNEKYVSSVSPALVYLALNQASGDGTHAMRYAWYSKLH